MWETTVELKRKVFFFDRKSYYDELIIWNCFAMGSLSYSDTLKALGLETPD